MIIKNGTWVVYVHVNKINNKPYVGITSSSDPKKRWGYNGVKYKGCCKFYNAIMKYGWNSFEHIIFAKNLTKEEACNMEKLLISKLDSINNGYNVEPGGVSQGPRSPEAIEKLRQARFRQIITPEQYEKGAAKRRGVKHSEERRAHQREVQRKLHGKPIMLIETGEIFTCAAEAAEKFHTNSSSITASAQRYSKNAKRKNRGLHWRYVTIKPDGYPDMGVDSSESK